MTVLQGTNRTQRLILGFFALILVLLVAILVFDPEIYDSTLNLVPGPHVIHDLAFLIAISAFISLLTVGVVRRWRWTFWLVLVAFLAGIFRPLASILQLLDVLPANAPDWYVELQAVIGGVQFLIAIAMIAGYRKGGVWAAF